MDLLIEKTDWATSIFNIAFNESGKIDREVA